MSLTWYHPSISYRDYLVYSKVSIPENQKSEIMKISTSCTRCRAGKRKCIVERGDLPCQQCLRQNKYCSFTNSPRQQTHLLPKLSTTGRENDTELSHFITPAPQELAETLIDLYLNLIHDKPHTLFSPSVLRRRVRDGTLPRAILYGIMALSAR